MRPSTGSVIVGILMFLFIGGLGCGGGAKSGIAEDPTASPCPQWYSQLPEDPDFLYAANTATSRDLQIAVDKAAAGARADLASQLEVHIEGLTTRFTQEVGLAEEADILAKYNSAIKQVIDQTMMGSKQKESQQKREGNVWRACVLMEYPIGDAHSDLVDRISKDRELYTRFQESVTFKQLNEEVEKFRAWKEKQGQ